RSGAVDSLAAASIGWSGTPADLAGRVSVSADAGTRVLTIAFTSRSAEVATAGADAVAEAYLRLKRTEMAGAMTDAPARLAGRMATLQAQADAANAVIAAQPPDSSLAREASARSRVLVLELAASGQAYAALQSFVIDPGRVIGPPASAAHTPSRRGAVVWI